MKSTTLYLRRPDRRKARKQSRTAWQELSGAVFRYRVQLAPYALAIWYAMITLIVGPRWPWVLPLSGMIPLSILGGLTLMRQRGIEPGEWTRKIKIPWFGKLDQKEQWYAVGVDFLAGTWGWFATWNETGRPSLRWYLILILGTTLAAVPWWYHRRIRGSIPVVFHGVPYRDRKKRGLEARLLVRDWDTFVHASGASGTELRSIVYDRWSVALAVILKRGHTVDDFTERRIRKLESAFDGVRRNSARVEHPDKKDARHAVFRFMLADPHAEPISPDMEYIPEDPFKIPVGLFETGSEVLLDLVHTLIAGASGAGKSVLVNAIILALAKLPFVAILGIDLKPGATELGPWKDVMHGLADDPLKAKVMLEALIQGMHRRGEIMRQRGWRKWKPTAAEPIIVLIVDEVQELKFAGLAGLLTRVSALARAFGFVLVVATQHPKDKLLPAEITANLTQKIGLRTEGATADRLIFGENATKDHWRPSSIPGSRKGSFLVRNDSYQTPVLARGFYIDDDDVPEMSRRFAPARTAIDAGTWEGHIEKFAPRAIQVGTDPELPDDGGDVVDGIIVENAPEDLVHMTIVAGHGTPKNIALLTGLNVRTVNRSIKSLAARGLVEQRKIRAPWTAVQKVDTVAS